MGHFLNRVLKDVFVKIALLDGKYAKFVPGWDMHGLPIELETLKHLGIKDFHTIDPLELREKCRERALYWLDRQRDTRVRMGNFGTVRPSVQHDRSVVRSDDRRRARRTRGEAADLQRLALDAVVRARRNGAGRSRDRIRADEARRRSTSASRRATQQRQRTADAASCSSQSSDADAAAVVLIWTTTPWTLPANVAIALRDEARTGCIASATNCSSSPRRSRRSALGERFADASCVATRHRRASSTAWRCATRLWIAIRRSCCADYVDLETGTGAVHTAPGHGADDFEPA